MRITRFRSSRKIRLLGVFTVASVMVLHGYGDNTKSTPNPASINDKKSESDKPCRRPGNTLASVGGVGILGKGMMGQEGAKTASLYAWLHLGQPARPGSFIGGTLHVEADMPSSILSTPQGLTYTFDTRLTYASANKTAAGAPRVIQLQDRDGKIEEYSFSDGQSVAFPQGTHKEWRSKLVMVDVNGSPVLNNPVYYDLVFMTGHRDRFIADTNNFGAFDSAILAEGRRITLTDSGIEIIKESSGVLRQIKVPQCYADIVTNSHFKYTVNLYPPASAGSKENGLYVFSGNPVVSWIVENPETNTVDKLTIRKVAGGKTNTYQFAYIADSKQWTLTQDGNLRSETKDIMRDDTGANRVDTREVKDQSGTVVFRNRQWLHNYTWGWVVTQEVTGAESDVYTNSTEYYSNAAEVGRCGRVKTSVKANGSWTAFDYDGSGRKLIEISGFKDVAVGSASNAAVATVYDYSPLDPNDTPLDNDQRPRTEIRTVLGIPVSRTFYAYVVTNNGERADIVEKCYSPSAGYGNTNNLRTVTTYYASTNGSESAGLVKSIAYPDGRLDSYSYEFGVYNSDTNPANCSFTAGEGDAFRTIVTHGIVSSPAGVANKSTRATTVVDGRGFNVLNEIYVYSGSEYERISWDVMTFDDFGHVNTSVRSDGTREDATWGANCCGKESETSFDGVQKVYSYDLLNRPVTVVKKGATTNDADFVRQYTYEADNHVLTEKISGGSLSLLVSSNTYNLAGQVVSSVDSLGIVTSFSRLNGGQISTTIRAGVTNYTESYLDGRAKLTKLNGVIQQYYDYGVNQDGTSWTITYIGPDGTNSPMWQKTTSDFLGRAIRTEQPGFGGTVITNESFYNVKGQQVKSVATGQVPMLYYYNDFMELVRSGMDVNTNGALDLASMDRISELTNYFEKVSDDWWQVSVSKIYAKDNSTAVTTNSIQMTKLTGLGTEGLVSYAVSQDILGNQTTSSTKIDRNNKTVIQSIKYPDSTNSVVSVSVNGFAVSSTSKSGLQTTFGYDTLERQVSTTNPRIGSSTTHYNGKGQVDWVMDAASNQTQFAYDPDTGRQISMTDALSNSVYSAYDNAKGLVVGTWGATYPVVYEYDDFFRMTSMFTYRGTNAINSYADLVALKSQMDRTQWRYEQATGLLTNKLYADTNGVSYTYTADGKLQTRVWARGIVTTYSSDPVLGVVTNISYSDGSPTVSFSLDRLGRQKTVADATGLRSFTVTFRQQCGIALAAV